MRSSTTRPRLRRAIAGAAATASVVIAGLAVHAPSAEAAAPSNDNLAGAQAIRGLPANATGSTVGATVQPGETVPRYYTAANTIWYTWTAPSTGPVHIDLGASDDIDTLLTVYTLAGSTLTPVAFNDDDTSVRSAVDLAAIAGTTYYLQIGGYWYDDFGTIRVAISPITTGLTGLVTDTAGHPIAGVRADVGEADAITNAQGRYVISADAGTYGLAFEGFNGSANVKSANGPTGIVVSDAAITSVPTTTLERGGVLTGRVLDQHGAPVVNACVGADGPSDGASGTDADGRYTISGLDAGSYSVDVEACDEPMFDTQSATATVAGTATSRVADIHVTLRSEIGGTVRNGSAPVQNTCVTAYSGATAVSHAITDSDGAYWLIVPVGTYKLRFTDDCTTPATLDLWFNAAHSQAAAPSITLRPGDILVGVDANTANGGTAVAAPHAMTSATAFESSTCVTAQGKASRTATTLAAAKSTLTRDQGKLASLKHQLKKAKKAHKTTKVTRLKKRIKAVKRTVATDSAAVRAATAADGQARSASSAVC